MNTHSIKAMGHKLTQANVIQDACKCPLEIVFYYLNGPTPGSLNSHYQVNDVTQTLESKGADICYQKYSRLRCLLRVKGLVICFYLGAGLAVFFSPDKI